VLRMMTGVKETFLKKESVEAKNVRRECYLQASLQLGARQNPQEDRLILKPHCAKRCKSRPAPALWTSDFKSTFPALRKEIIVLILVDEPRKEVKHARNNAG